MPAAMGRDGDGGKRIVLRADFSKRSDNLFSTTMLVGTRVAAENTQNVLWDPDILANGLMGGWGPPPEGYDDWSEVVSGTILNLDSTGPGIGLVWYVLNGEDPRNIGMQKGGLTVISERGLEVGAAEGSPAAKIIWINGAWRLDGGDTAALQVALDEAEARIDTLESQVEASGIITQPPIFVQPDSVDVSTIGEVVGREAINMIDGSGLTVRDETGVHLGSDPSPRWVPPDYAWSGNEIIFLFNEPRNIDMNWLWGMGDPYSASSIKNFTYSYWDEADSQLGGVESYVGIDKGADHTVQGFPCAMRYGVRKAILTPIDSYWADKARLAISEVGFRHTEIITELGNPDIALNTNARHDGSVQDIERAEIVEEVDAQGSALALEIARIDGHTTQLNALSAADLLVAFNWDAPTRTLSMTDQQGDVTAFIIPDNVVTLVDDLTSGGTTSALTAEQGFIMGGVLNLLLSRVEQLETQIADQIACARISWTNDCARQLWGMFEQLGLPLTPVVTTPSAFLPIETLSGSPVPGVETTDGVPSVNDGKRSLMVAGTFGLSWRIEGNVGQVYQIKIAIYKPFPLPEGDTLQINLFTSLGESLITGLERWQENSPWKEWAVDTGTGPAEGEGMAFVTQASIPAGSDGLLVSINVISATDWYLGGPTFAEVTEVAEAT